MGQGQAQSTSEVKKQLPPQGSISANQITPYLFIGNYASAASKEYLTSNGIRYVLNMTTFPHDQLPDVEYLWLSAGDREDFDLSQYFKDSHSFIEKARQSQSKVLVHCEMGISRSATIVMAHLMLQDPDDIVADAGEECAHRTLRQAWDLVRSHRSCCCPNEGFFEQLLKVDRRLHHGKASMSSLDYEMVANTARTKMQMMLFDSLSDSAK